MEVYDDGLREFEAEGAAPLPVPDEEDYVENEGARIWYATYGLARLLFCYMVVWARAAIGATRFRPWGKAVIAQ
jgi:hypothetical protein